MQIKHERSHRRARAALALAASFVGGMGLFPVFESQLRAGTRRDDVSDSLYLSLGNSAEYASVGAITWPGNLGSGTVISPRFVLSAAHVTEGSTTRTFSFGPDTNNLTLSVNSSYFVNNPGWNTSVPYYLRDGQDISFIRLSSPITTVTPASRFFDTGSGELNRDAVTIGYGQGGTGSVGATLASGTKRGFDNTLDALGNIWSGYSANLLLGDFDSPAGTSSSLGSTQPLPREGMVAPGDSGGGTFVDIDGRKFLVGVTSFVASTDGLQNASYSDLYGLTRVSVFNQWIDDNIVHYWNSASAGSFGDSARWTLGTGANAAAITPTTGDIAGFNQNATYTVTLGGSTQNHQLLARGGNVTVNLGGHAYTLTSQMHEGAMIVARYSGETAAVTYSNGTVNSRDVLVAQQVGSNGHLTVGSAATLNVTGDLLVGGSHLSSGGNAQFTVNISNSTANVSGRMRVFGGGLVTYNAGTLSAGSIDVRSGGRINLASGGNKVLQTRSLQIEDGGKLDLSDNDMIVNYDGASPIELIKSYIRTGRGGGTNDGTGIITTAGTSNTRLGYGEAGVLGFGTFDDIGVDNTTLLIKYTYSGDANLDGKVDKADLGLLSSSWNTSGYWHNGDFNYDGRVDSGDLLLIAGNWLAGVTGPLASPVSFAAALDNVNLSLSNVPEPSIVGLLGIAALTCVSRRRRRQR